MRVSCTPPPPPPNCGTGVLSSTIVGECPSAGWVELISPEPAGYESCPEHLEQLFLLYATCIHVRFHHAHLQGRRISPWICLGPLAGGGGSSGSKSSSNIDCGTKDAKRTTTESGSSSRKWSRKIKTQSGSLVIQTNPILSFQVSIKGTQGLLAKFA